MRSLRQVEFCMGTIRFYLGADNRSIVMENLGSGVTRVKKLSREYSWSEAADIAKSLANCIQVYCDKHPDYLMF